MKKLSIAAIILSVIAIMGQIFVFATQRDSDDATYKKALQANYRIYAPILPDTLFFAGERVPLETYYVHEGLDRELMVHMYWQSNMLLWIKRANRYFPVIEPILKRNGVPSDFKYLCVIESGLSNATSGAKAQGFWQFMKPTAANYGLEVNDDIDMRNNVAASTEAACKYLKDAYARFGSWTAAAASYNCGMGGLSGRLTKQDVNSYYDVHINSETARYVYRILAAKLIMQHLQDYGYCVRQRDLYPVIPTKTVELSGQNIDLYDFAKKNGVSYKVLRDLNPWITTDKLTNKANRTYTVNLPSGGIKIDALLRGQSSNLVSRI